MKSKSAQTSLFCLLLVAILFNSAFVNAERKSFTQQELNALKEMKIIKLVVKQSYENTKSLKLPIEKELQGLFKRIGIEVVYGDAKNIDATFLVDVKGHAVGYQYSGKTGSAYWYTGASVNGNVSLYNSSSNFYESPFHSIAKPFSLILSIGPKTPDGAPFGRAYWGSFYEKFADMVLTLWGTKRVRTFLEKDIDNTLRYKTAKILKKINWEPSDEIETVNFYVLLGDIKRLVTIGKPAVLPLIDIMTNNKEDYNDRCHAAMALGAIKDERAISYLKAEMLNSSGSLSNYAAEALGNMGLIEELILDLKKHREPPLSYHIKRGLIAASEPAVPYLIPLLKSKQVQESVMEILRKITGNRIYEAEKWKEWWEQNKETFK